MDFITRAMAKKYTDAQKLANIEYGYGSVKFSDDTTDKLTIPSEAVTEMFGSPIPSGIFVRVLDEPIAKKLNDITETRYSDHNINSGSAVFKTIDGLDGFVFVCMWGRDYPSVFSVYSGDEFEGTYVLHTADTYVSELTGHIEEIVTPIDPKFIPPMDSITLNGADGKQYAITVNESGALVATAIE